MQGVEQQYLSLGSNNKGTPVVLEKKDSNFNKLWQRGEQKPRPTVCNGNEG